MTNTNIAIASRTPTLEIPVPACDDIADRVSRKSRRYLASDSNAIITVVNQVSLGDGPEFHDLDAILPGDARARRRMVAQTTLRILGTTVPLLLLYAVVPVPGTSGAAAVVGLIGGLIVFVALVGWQTRSIVRAHQPVLRAVEVVAFALPLLVVVFAYTYHSLSEADPAAFSEELDRIGAVYFAVSILGTVGLGDISPATDATRLLVTLQTLLDIALIAGFVRIVIIATRTGLRRKGSGH
jgi:voltage-gated potassium channel